MSNLRLFRDGDGFAWIERRSVREPQLTELKKYAVFSKVTIAPDDERVLLGVAGFQARAALANLFSELPSKEKQVFRIIPPSVMKHLSRRKPVSHSRKVTRMVEVI